MSQYWLSVGGGGTPTIPTSFVTDVGGPAVPAANVLDLLGASSTDNNPNGIQTDGATAATVKVELTNRQVGTVQTTDATPTAVITFDCATAGATNGVYTFSILACAFDSTNTQANGYQIVGTVRTDGSTTATLVGTPDKIVNEETTSADFNLVVSGNNAIVQATGVAATTINWNAQLEYIYQATP